MLAAEGKPGRIFVLRLENGDLIPDCIEEFAAVKNIKVALITIVGGVNKGRIVVGPESSSTESVEPVLREIGNQPHEIISSGIIIPDQNGKPIAHIHGALGRGEETVVGCLRNGIETWLMGEVIVQEVLGTDSVRIAKGKSALSFLEP